MLPPYHRMRQREKVWIICTSGPEIDCTARVSRAARMLSWLRASNASWAADSRAKALATRTPAMFSWRTVLTAAAFSCTVR